MKTNQNFFVYAMVQDEGSIVTQYAMYCVHENTNKLIFPGVYTTRQGLISDTNVQVHKNPNIGQIYLRDIDFLIREFFPENSGPEIKKILGVE